MWVMERDDEGIALRHHLHATMLCNQPPYDFIMNEDGVLHDGRVPLPHCCGALYVCAHQRHLAPAYTHSEASVVWSLTC